MLQCVRRGQCIACHPHALHIAHAVRPPTEIRGLSAMACGTTPLPPAPTQPDGLAPLGAYFLPYPPNPKNLAPLGPTGLYSLEMGLGPTGRYSPEMVLGPTGRCSPKMVLGPTGRYSQEMVLGPSGRADELVFLKNGVGTDCLGHNWRSKSTAKCSSAACACYWPMHGQYPLAGPVSTQPPSGT
jgi:hypothetical protein